MIQIDRIEYFDQLQKLESEWNRLLSESNNDNFFITFEWASSWWLNYGKDNRLMVLVAKSNDKIVGIAPLMVTKIKYRGVCLKAVTFIANDQTSRADFVLGNENKREVLYAMISYLHKNHVGNDILFLEYINKQSENSMLLLEILNSMDIRHFVKASLVSPFIRIDRTWNEYLNGSSKHLVKKLNRTSKTYNRLEGLEITEYTDKSIDEGMDELLTVSRNTWKYSAGSAIASQDENVGFYKALANACASNGWFRLWIMKIQSKPVSFFYGICYRNRLFGLKSGYDEEYAKIAPSHYMYAYVFRHCFENKMDEIDLLGQNDTYKLLWTNLSREHMGCVFFANSFFGRLLCFVEAYIITGVKLFLRKSGFNKPKAQSREDDTDA
jgi:CelD/BcsL family acetyltransferase involved in cellulose biosynthesis